MSEQKLRAELFLAEFWKVLDDDSGYNGRSIEDYVGEKLKEAEERGARKENEAILKLCEEGYVRDDIIEDIRARMEGK